MNKVEIIRETSMVMLNRSITKFAMENNVVNITIYKGEDYYAYLIVDNSNVASIEEIKVEKSRDNEDKIKALEPKLYKIVTDYVKTTTKSYEDVLKKYSMQVPPYLKIGRQLYDAYSALATYGLVNSLYVSVIQEYVSSKEQSE